MHISKNLRKRLEKNWKLHATVKRRSNVKTHREMIDEWMKEPEFVAEYDALADEFALFDEMLKARKNAGLTQADIAKKMGTKTPAIARLEASGRHKKHSPSLATLQKYADAVGCRLDIRLIPR